MERFAFPHTSHKIFNEQSYIITFKLPLYDKKGVKKYSPEATSKISFDLTLKSIKSVI